METRDVLLTRRGVRQYKSDPIPEEDLAEILEAAWHASYQRKGSGGELRARFAPDKGEFVAAITLGYLDETPRIPPRREGRWAIL